MEQIDYLAAAKVVAECKPSRLPQVLAILKQGGIDVPAADVKAAYAKIVAIPSDEERRKDKRKTEGHREWDETDNEAILRLREAYDAGASFTELSRLTGITRTTLYRYMYGELADNPTRDKHILAVLGKLHLKAPIKSTAPDSDGLVSYTIRVPQDLLDAYLGTLPFWESDPNDNPLIRFMQFRVREYAQQTPETKPKAKPEEETVQDRPFWEDED